MEQIIAIKNQGDKQIVNARELHQFLDVGKEFANWIKDRINQYGFIENEDFEVFANFGKNSKGGRPSKEYAISLDMAKELSMVERNEKGKRARRYFIECEKHMRKSHTNSLSSATELLSLPIRPIAEKRKKMQQELMQVIRLNLNKGDLKKLSEENSLSYNRVRNVASSKTFDYNIMFLLYDTARNNLMFLDTELGAMKEDLQIISA